MIKEKKTYKPIKPNKARTDRRFMCERAKALQDEYTNFLEVIGVKMTLKKFWEFHILPKYEISFTSFINYIDLDIDKELKLLKNPKHIPSKKIIRKERERVKRFSAVELKKQEAAKIERFTERCAKDLTPKPHSQFTNQEAKAHLKKLREDWAKSTENDRKY